MKSFSDGRGSAWEHGAPLAALMTLCAARLWLMPLGSSFWIDEMGTVFVVRHGAADPSLAVAPQVGASLYYWLPRAASALFGSSEAVYRLPSVLAIALAVWLASRVAARVIHPAAAWFGAFACIAISGIDYQAADARPYGLGTCVAAAGVLFLVRWLDEARWRDGLLFALFAALLWPVHLIFWPFYLVFAAYAASRLLRKETHAGWTRTLLLFATTGLALIPTLLEALDLFRQAKAHVIVKPPSLHELEHSLRWNVVVLCAAGAWVIRKFGGADLPACLGPRRELRDQGGDRRAETRGSAASVWLLFLLWWLAQPVCLFAFSWVTGNSVFVKRYLFLMLPGAALTATAAVARFTPPARMNKLAAVLGLAALAALGDWTQLWPAHEHSDWRDAALKINQLALDADTPVICPSPFIEARPPVWTPDYRMPGFLYAHLPVYPIRGHAYLFPFETSPEAESYAAGLARGALSHSRRFFLYGGNGATRFWRKWFAARPELAGWRSERLYYGDVDVIDFEPPK